MPEVQLLMSKQGLMECHSIWKMLGKLYVKFMLLNTDLEKLFCWSFQRDTLGHKGIAI